MSTVNWTAFTDRGNLAGTILNSLADVTLSAASTELDNGTNRDTHAIVEINLGSFTSVTVAYLELYMIKNILSNGYEQAPVIGGTDRNTLIATIPVPAGTAAYRVMTGLIALPPCAVKFYVGNQTNAALAASANSIDVYTANLASV